MTEFNGRKADYPIDPMFLDRWSPRAFTGEPISQDKFFTMLEAARWAPSSGNAQPWRFVYGLHGTPAFDRLLGLLVPGNAAWAKNASALVFFLSKKTGLNASGNVVEQSTHSFDTGTASGLFALQVRHMGWYAHGMWGFDHERAYTELNVPGDYRIEAAYAVGRHGDPASLPAPLAEREKPNQRRPLSELVFEGEFKS
ncbi:MAG TPA: nitroreductase family protein [Edaphobacter sp.]